MTISGSRGSSVVSVGFDSLPRTRSLSSVWTTAAATALLWVAVATGLCGPPPSCCCLAFSFGLSCVYPNPAPASAPARRRLAFTSTSTTTTPPPLRYHHRVRSHRCTGMQLPLQSSSSSTTGSTTSSSQQEQPQPPQPPEDPQEALKQQVGYQAVDDYVKSGMVVGLGTGSTAFYAVERVGAKLQSGALEHLVCIPTSVRTKEQAEAWHIPLATLNGDTYQRLNVTIDGTDQVDPQLQLVKGGGGALLREKMVEIVSDQFIVIVDESKMVPGLGPGFPIPVEIVPFCHAHTLRVLEQLPSTRAASGTAILRRGSASNNLIDGDDIAVTDNGNYIVDLHFDKMIDDPVRMAEEINHVVGVVEHGLFCNMASVVIIAGKDGIRVEKAR